MVTRFIRDGSYVTEYASGPKPLTLEALQEMVANIFAKTPPHPTTLMVSRSTYKMIRKWERSRVMRYETGVPVLGKRFRIVRSRWKVIQRQS